jgi:thiol:disulfide interchange protein
MPNKGQLLNLEPLLRLGILVSAVVLLIIGLCGAIVYAPAGAEARGHLHWGNSVESGISDAKKHNKYVLADFYTDWCGWCKKLDKETFKDSNVIAYLNSKFVCVKVNAEGSPANQALAKKYNVHGFPCAIVLNSQGKYVGRLSGYLDAGQYETALEELIHRPNGNSSSGGAKSGRAE